REPVPRHVGSARVQARVPEVPAVRAGARLPAHRRHARVAGMTRRLTRRDFGRRVAQAGLAAAVVPPLRASMSQPGPSSDPRIVPSASPSNLEADFGALDSYITPVPQHYVRNHFPVPDVHAASWRLRVEGAVARALSLSLAELRELPAVTRTVTLECAGNGRLLLTPKVPGVQWERGAVSTAEWTGVSVDVLLERAGLREDAVDLVGEGLDVGEPGGTPRPVGEISYHRGLPVGEARRRGVLVAYAMNGAPLEPLHGAPARLVVPGAYGMASVRWLSRLIVTDTPFDGYWQTIDYAYWDRSGPFPQRRPLPGIQVKSLVAQPWTGATVERGARVAVRGAAWSEGAITRVEVSTDGGTRWSDATLE